MLTWLNSQQLAIALSVTQRQAKRIIASRAYKKQPLSVRQEKSKKGKPSYFVYWDTDNNQPATYQGDTDAIATACATEKPVLLTQPPANPHEQPSTALVCAPLAQNPAPELPTQTLPAQQERGNEPALQTAVITPLHAPIELKPAAYNDFASEIDFVETLIHRKNQDKTPQQKAAYKAQCLKAYFDSLTIDESLKPQWLALKNALQRSKFAACHQLTGVIPPKLLTVNALSLTGRKSTLTDAVTARFIEMVMTTADKNHDDHATRKLRTVVNFHRLLQKEFQSEIPLGKLYSVVRKHKLAHWFEIQDDDTGEVKMNSFFPVIPTGSLVMMDGVKSHYFEIRDAEGKFRRINAIELYDAGSRYMMAMHAYFSESSANSVDIFSRFLKGNTFAHQAVEIRPDNAGGFLNLARPIKELNNKYAVKDGFTFVFAPARAGTPKDKASLESSHKRFHKYEHYIISHFKDKKAGSYQQKNIKTGETVTIIQLDITLAELNDSGVIAEYVTEWNNKKGNFREDGVGKRWRPADRWQAHCDAHANFVFESTDIATLEIYGFEKREATISKEGVITYQTQKYQVLDRSLFSTQKSTPVKISGLSDGTLAIFHPEKEGVLLGKASPYQAPDSLTLDKVSKKKVAQIKKATDDGEYYQIESYLSDLHFEVSPAALKVLFNQGLTKELSIEIVNKPKKIDRFKHPSGMVKFNLFKIDVEERLKKPTHQVPYSNGERNEKA